MSNATGPQSLSRLLADLPTLRRLICDARSRSADSAESEPLDLPPALAAHTRIQLLPDCLLLLASNNSVAQLLRFHGPRLAKAAAVSRFQVRVEAEAFNPAAQRRHTQPAPTLSSDSAAILQQTAEQIEHAPLADALKRLAALASDS